MNDKPTVSVLVPTYNRADTIEPALLSIIKQSFQVSEIIVVDDGSTDETETIINGISQTNYDWKGRIKYLKQSNQGKSAALNLALPLVESDWIAFNDSDDIWKSNKLEKQFGALTLYPHCNSCFCDTLFGESGENTTLEIAGTKPTNVEGTLPELTYILASRASGIMMQTLVVKTETMKAFGQFDTQLSVTQDTDLLFRLSLISDFCYVNDPLVILDRDDARPDRLTKRYPTTDSRRLKEDLHMKFKWKLNTNSSDTRLTQLLNTGYYSMLSALSNSYLAEDDFPNAEKYIKRAFRESKSVKYGIKWLMTKLIPSFTKALMESRIKNAH